MNAPSSVPGVAPAAALIVIEPGGGRSRTSIFELPFFIGRQAGSHLVLRDARVSRSHARIVLENGAYVVEDLGSLNGVFVNGERVTRRPLNQSDRIGFGAADSYQAVFTMGEHGLEKLAENIVPSRPGQEGELTRLRAVVELARAVEASLSPADVLAALVDAALAITGAERGFLLLQQDGRLEFRVARDSRGQALTAEDLRVPTTIIHRALTGRRELLSMSFDPQPTGPGAMNTIAELELRSVVCVPLVRVGTGVDPAAAPVRPVDQTIGVLYLDTRAGEADLASSAHELLQTLAVEASIILENARLLEGERELKRMESELDIAREIQENLLPRELPATGWLRAAGRSIPSRQVGGDYFDLRQVDPSTWALVIADVSGKGVSSALLASLLQGVFLAAPVSGLAARDAMLRINSFLIERTGGEKYATVFFATLERDGLLRYINAGHGIGLLVRVDGRLEELDPTGPPVGMLEEATYTVKEELLSSGDKLVLFTDGLIEAEDAEGRALGMLRVRKMARDGAGLDSQAILEALGATLGLHTGGAVQKDDITVMVVEYRSERG